jgi:hypothetical protein
MRKEASVLHSVLVALSHAQFSEPIVVTGIDYDQAPETYPVTADSTAGVRHAVTVATITWHDPAPETIALQVSRRYKTWFLHAEPGLLTGSPHAIGSSLTPFTLRQLVRILERTNDYRLPRGDQRMIWGRLWQCFDPAWTAADVATRITFDSAYYPQLGAHFAALFPVWHEAMQRVAPGLARVRRVA